MAITMKALYKMFKKFGKQTDRNEYSLLGCSVEFYSQSNMYVFYVR